MPAGKPTRGRPPKQKGNRGRMTVRLPVDTIAGIKRAARRQEKSQADVIDDAVRLILIAEGFIKENQTHPPRFHMSTPTLSVPQVRYGLLDVQVACNCRTLREVQLPTVCCRALGITIVARSIDGL